MYKAVKVKLAEIIMFELSRNPTALMPPNDCTDSATVTQHTQLTASDRDTDKKVLLGLGSGTRKLDEEN